jgi:hypothetical protein
MPQDKTHYIGCSVKALPEDRWIDAANTAVGVNPANAPSRQMLAKGAPGVVLEPSHLALLTSKYWGSTGVTLTVSFMDNPPANLRDRILAHMNAWGEWARVTFTFTTGVGKVRIARTPNDGHWSYLGTDILSIPAARPTMNLDSFTMSTPDSEFYRVVRHETGHTLGFPHEHMRKKIIDNIDKPKAIEYFRRTQDWSAAETTAQVLTPMSESALMASAQADMRSIMCYSLPGSIMKDGVAVPGGIDIDAQDAVVASALYPKPIGQATSLFPNGKAYFFKGAQYSRYDPVLDKVDAGFPQPIAGNWPGMPAAFASGITASVVWNNGKAYFFDSTNYVQYDLATGKVDAGAPKPVNGNWPGLGTAPIDAVVRWPTNGKAYFFSGSKYFRYDIATNTVDTNWPKPIAGNWLGFPAAFAAGVDAAVVWDNGKAYFFKGSQYLRYDIALNKTDPGYPLPIAGNWPGLFTSSLDA